MQIPPDIFLEFLVCGIYPEVSQVVFPGPGHCEIVTGEYKKKFFLKNSISIALELAFRNCRTS